MLPFDVATTRLILSDFLPYRLSVTSNRVSQMIANQYHALFGLTIPEWRVIAVVAENGAATQQAICGITRMDKVSVSRAAITLVNRNILTREANLQDKRSHLLALTPSGQHLYEVVVPRALDIETRIFLALSAEERRELQRFLARLDASMNAMEINDTLSV